MGPAPDPARLPRRALDVRTNRALSSVRRVRIFQELRDGPRDVRALTTATGLHPSTVRSHLTVLQRAGLVVAHPDHPEGPGRPRLLYALAEVPPEPSPHPYEGITAVLASSLRRATEDPAGTAEREARPWGRSLAGDSEPPRSVGEALERVTALLDEVGFDPALVMDEATGRAEILLHRCPFDDVARRYGDIVCSVHLGMIRGALEELGVSVRVDELLPYVRPTLCLAKLSFPPTSDNAAPSADPPRP